MDGLEQLLGYTYVGGKKLRNGITTGTCATAAAKAALEMLLSKSRLEYCRVDLPIGKKLVIPISNIKMGKDYVSCCVVKDAGDDPDITNGIEIYAKVERNDSQEIIIKGGQGIGMVTKKGLPVELGKHAINPVPYQMIKDACKKLLPEGEGIIVTIYAPEGERLAKKTLNSKLGIIGGISVLGTTGIVKPMSEDAYKESLRIELEMYVKNGHSKVILVPGNYGYDFCQDILGMNRWPIIKMSNFVGYMLEQCERLKVKEVLMVGDLGKFIKVSGGIFQTHSRQADCRIELMIAYVALLGGDQQLLQELLEASTTVAAIEILVKQEFNEIQNLYKKIAEGVTSRATSYCHEEVNVGTVIFSRSTGELYRDKSAEQMIKEMKNE
ncbi:cobalt-precorrin-5B (C(1))-methyltransferase CbiD [Vallitalea okinawensis]|uniref:cobalt-precorrin-5B (C(1))-methyltransferase CbiD n=1 Tax=Vallitalea okinawensis TaxID=2078660 RepID=UPI000CFDAA99|nr:cobalt-precorrin-5B (C(1))-methyltransferase CbiD [Vallitalea okinawensis]